MSELVLSLFPGIGLLDRAFEEEGYCVVRGPDLLWGGDVRRFHPPAGRFQGIIGGPPCPDFSPLRYLIAAHGYKSKHGNLIPEFERVVAEAQPDWWLMEEGPLAPDAHVPSYAQFGFFLCPTWLGEEQSRRRKFCFGVKGAKPVDLRQFIDYAIFEPLEAEKGLLFGQGQPGGRQAAIISSADPPSQRRSTTEVIKLHQQAVLADGDVLGSGLGRVRQPTVLADHDGGEWPKVHPLEWVNGKVTRRPRRSWEESCRLQGLPGDFLKDAPFTLTGKRMVLGNGVPLQMGRAVARAVRQASATRATGAGERALP